MKRVRQPTRVFLIRSASIRDRLISEISELIIDESEPIEILVRERVDGRSNRANSMMWAGPLKDIAEQAKIDGRVYSEEIWHQYLKKELLPEEFDEELCKSGYVKWDFGPDGDRILVGSTAKLTVRGFSEYIMAIEAFGASLGVVFTSNHG